MPVFKYRGVEELNTPAIDYPFSAGDSGWSARVARLWERSARLNPRSFPPGVYKYDSIAAASEAREEWLRQHVQDLKAARQKR